MLTQLLLIASSSPTSWIIIIIKTRYKFHFLEKRRRRRLNRRGVKLKAETELGSTKFQKNHVQQTWEFSLFIFIFYFILWFVIAKIKITIKIRKKKNFSLIFLFHHRFRDKKQKWYNISHICIYIIANTFDWIEWKQLFILIGSN
jgi:hypothetical protein